MILQVIKENDSFPVGIEFLYNEHINMFVCVHRIEEISDDVSYVSEEHFQFSPAFYEENKELFYQVKLEETNEKDKNIEGPKSSETEGQSEDVCDQNPAVNRNNFHPYDELYKKLQRKKMEEATEGSESEGPSIHQGRPDSPEREYKESREKNQRIVRFATIDNLLFNLINQIQMLQEGIVWNLRDEIEQLRNEIR